MKVGTRVLALAVLAAASAQAAHAAGTDPSHFDVAGVKLGMTEQQAAAAMSQHLHVAPGAIKLFMSGPIKFIEATSNGAKVVAYFSRDALGGHPNAQVVDHIIYSEADTDQNEKSMTTAALAKYGKPSMNALAGDYQWCVNNGMFCDSAGPELHLYNAKLELTDPQYTAANLKADQAKQTAKTQF